MRKYLILLHRVLATDPIPLLTLRAMTEQQRRTTCKLMEMFKFMFKFMFQLTLFSRRPRRKKRKRIRNGEDSAEKDEEIVLHHHHSVLVHRQSNSLASTLTRKTLDKLNMDYIIPFVKVFHTF